MVEWLSSSPQLYQRNGQAESKSYQNKHQMIERRASAVHLRENYRKKYNWKEESGKFEKMILQLALNPIPKETEITEKAVCCLNETMETHKETLTVLTATDDVPHSSLEVGKTERNDQRESAPGFSVDSKDATGRTSLRNASLNGSVQAMKGLIKRGADPSLVDNRGWNALHFAATGGDTDVIDLILTHLPDIESETAPGYTPLMVAALNGKLHAVKWFVGKGANVTCVDNNRWNMLHFAAHGGDTDFINPILTHLPDIESKTAQGYTPLMVAALNGKLHAVKWFVEKGANVTCVDNK
ncbi:ankyrin repeat and EF-hand domain-containing protein 1-like [Stylophora pistillata]|uniref:Ankyrin repeat, PH and SEC7 domain containing protein secG n=1 Tax=Stylophora pistillata TaxID=50429 RepID=A0A2B4RI29_STYPI|nr:ankyrin repeat and EF-hand domain-containing protein 1-like [Stylophora pistillata]PFX16017.1 Ankyrin repeat, PH and SEC7 domain containing protein secG [Stylophora pistillata]